MMEEWTKRQEEIMDQAMLIIAKNGIQGLTIRSLAREIGVSEPALYRHFESKTDILLGILDRFDRKSEGMRAMARRNESSSLDLLESLMVTTLSQFQQRPEIAAVIFAEEIFQNEPRLTEKVADIMRKHQASLHALLSRGQQSGEIRNDLPVEKLVLLIQGAQRLLVSRWRNSGYGFDLVEEGRSLSMVLRTLLTINK